MACPLSGLRCSPTCAGMILSTMRGNIPGGEETLLTRLHVAGHPDCGTWLENHDFGGFDITASSKNVSGRDACKALCEETPLCNAATFNKFSQYCWVKTIPDDKTPTSTSAGDSIRVCEPSGAFCVPPKCAVFCQNSMFHQQDHRAH